MLGESLRGEVGCTCEFPVQKHLSAQLAVRVWKVIKNSEVVNDRVLLWRFFTAVFGEEPVTEGKNICHMKPQIKKRIGHYY